MDDWKHFKDIDFADEGIKQYHIDTRDFHCATNPEEQTEHKFIFSPKNEKIFYHTAQEVKETITRLFTESGGDKRYFFLSLCGEGEKHSQGWQLKYIRIYRTAKGLIIANRHGYALSKNVLSSEVKKEY